MAERVSIIIISFNTRDLTRKCLASVLKSSIRPLEVIVVDNASVDGSVEMIRQEFPQVRLIENRENVGFAKANNQAIRQAQGEYVWLLNSDTEIGASSLEEAFSRSRIAERDDIAAVIPQLDYPDGSWQSVGGYFPSLINVFLYFFPLHNLLPSAWRKKIKLLALYPQQIPSTGKELDYLTGAAIIIKKAALDKVGLLGEQYFMYFEETDLCWRLKKAGYILLAIGTDPVMHVYGGSFRSRLDLNRLKLFRESLGIFVRSNYSGIGRSAMLLEIKLFSPLSESLKSLKAKKN